MIKILSVVVLENSSSITQCIEFITCCRRDVILSSNTSSNIRIINFKGLGKYHCAYEKVGYFCDVRPY